MEFKFTLILKTGELIIADPPPTGWETVDINLKRDPVWHGVFFDYGLNPLSFVGNPAAVITEEYDNNGVSGQMAMRVDVRCSDGQFTLFYQGNIDFVSYQKSCGLECAVTVEVADSQDIMLFRNNYAQKVNINSNVAFDKTTILTDYVALNTDITIPGRGLPLLTKGNSLTGPAIIYPITVTWPSINNNNMAIRPSYSENQNSEISLSDLDGGLCYFINQTISPHPNRLEPVIAPAISETCLSGAYNYTFRFKGHIKSIVNDIHSCIIQLVLLSTSSYPGPNSPALAKVTLVNGNFSSGGGPDIDFDHTFSGSLPLEEGEELRGFIFVSVNTNLTNPTQNVWVDWDSETMVRITTISQCDPTPAKVTLINEAVSRCVEAITNDGIRFYSTFYGRTNSQPYAIDEDTCAGMQAITNGLNVRRRLLVDGVQPGFFVTMQQLFEHQRRLYNIGLTIEKDPQRAGFNRLRFEDWRYFYQTDYGGLFFRPDQIEKKVDTARCFNRISLGFTKWEAEQFSGLDEFMTTREYRTGIDSLDNVLDIKTDLICSPYTTEITRRKDSTTQDWKYDNDVFSFALLMGAPTYTVEGFQNVTTGVENVSDSGSAYNARFRPAVIAMRWFNYVMQGIKKITSASALIFTEGTGNYIAKLMTNNCNIEGVPIRENEDIDITDYNNVQDAAPITQPELDSFTTPMTFNIFMRLLTEPDLRFKTIKYACNGTVYDGWINNLQYSLGDDGGMAQLEIIPVNAAQIVTPEPPCGAMVENVQVTVLDNLTGHISVSFDELAPGADNWNWAVYDDTNTLVASGNVNGNPFELSGFGEGYHVITIIPRCGNNIGSNTGTGTFTITGAQLLIELSITDQFGESFTLRAVRVGGGPFTNDFSFRFGQCFTDVNGTECYGYPTAPLNPANYRTLSALTGQTSKIQKFGPRNDPSVVDSLTLHNLIGITAGQISKAAGQTWDLNFD